MPQPEQEPPVAAARPPGADREVVAAAVALLEAAALTAAMRRVAAWNPLVCLDTAADRLWVAAGGEDQGGWRSDPSRQAAGFRLAVLLAEATIGRCLAEDGYLSGRQLSVDLRQAAAWLRAGAQFDGSQQATTAGSGDQPWRPWRRSNRRSAGSRSTTIL